MKSFTGFFQNITLAKKILLVLTPVVSMLITIKSALIGLLLLIVIDLITGIRKSHYQKGIVLDLRKKVFWASIKSYLLRQTWKKTYEYGIGIIVVLVFESLVFGSTSIILMDKVFTISELAVLLPAAIEVWSIFENQESITGRNILKKMSDFLPEPFKELFKRDNQDVQHK